MNKVILQLSVKITDKGYKVRMFWRGLIDACDILIFLSLAIERSFALFRTEISAWESGDFSFCLFVFHWFSLKTALFIYLIEATSRHVNGFVGKFHQWSKTQGFFYRSLLLLSSSHNLSRNFLLHWDAIPMLYACGCEWHILNDGTEKSNNSDSSWWHNNQSDNHLPLDLLVWKNKPGYI